MKTSETLSKIAPAFVKAQAAMAGATKSAKVIPKRQKAVPRHTVELS